MKTVRILAPLLLLVACGGNTDVTPPPAAPLPPPPVATAQPSPAVGVAAPRTDPNLIPRNTFFGNPERTSPQISPDGKWIAFLAPVDGVLNVMVAPADDITKAQPVTHDKARPIRQFEWPDRKSVCRERV